MFRNIFKCIVCAAICVVAVSASALTVSSGDVELGVWNSGFYKAKAYAEENNLPLVVFWGATGCAYCNSLKTACSTAEFTSWQKGSGLVLCQINDKSSAEQQAAKTFVGNGSYPLIRIYWNRPDGSVSDVKFVGRAGTMKNGGTGTLARQFINAIEAATAGYVPEGSTPVYSGGLFADGDSVGNRLEAEASTRKVTVSLTRDEKIATNVTLRVVGPKGDLLEEKDVAWAEGEKEQTVDVDIPEGVFGADGEQVTLTLVSDDKEGTVKSTQHITYVEKENGAANPLWKTERTAPASGAKLSGAALVPELAFGEWTVDLETAKALAKSKGGMVLVSIQGSLWCPDCANTDRNFLDVKDESGQNRFRIWAAEKKLALVAMDIPNYTGQKVTDFSTPTIFSKKASATTLARAKEYPASGADESLTASVVRSGLGYMTRKGISDEDATEFLEKFHELAITDTDKGGFHRPEDANKNRTGVPIFVLLRGDGTVAARFTRFASVSPMAADCDNFDNYLKRFEEMLAIAADSGDHADSTEIENNYPGDGAIPLAANGGKAEGELCCADFQDAFKLDVTGNVVQEVFVSGKSDATVNVQFWKKNSDGSYGVVGSALSGVLSTGVTLKQTFATSGAYYVLVKGANAADAEFAPENATVDNFIPFTIEGATILVPGDDYAEASAPVGEKTVKMKLSTGVVYRFSGIDVASCESVLECMSSLDDGTAFCKAKTAGDIEIPLKSEGGVVGYQIWKPGKPGFVDEARTVAENAGQVEFKVVRSGGKSGFVRALVSIDEEQSTMEKSRYVFEPQEIEWADGVSSNMVVGIQILDDQQYDGDGNLVFKLEILESEAGDVEVAANRSVFTLTVTEDDKAEPGRGLVTGVSPAYAKKGAVYVRSGEGAEIFVSRIEASDGRVGMELKSSLTGVEFSAAKEDDITVEGAKSIFWWANREIGEKSFMVKGIPAGKNARISVNTYEAFKTITASNTVTVYAVADDAPGFTSEISEFAISKYVAVSDCKVGLDQMTGGDVTFTKLSGTLPSGLKAGYDKETQSLSFSGAPTVKPGRYEVTYQVTETRVNESGKKVKVAGLTTTVVFVLSDPTDAKTYPEVANASVAKSRTFKDVAVFSTMDKRLAGILQVTIPQKGNVSAKYMCAAGTISFSAKNWNAFDAETKTLTATPSTSKPSGYSMVLNVADDGTVQVELDDPAYESCTLTASIAAETWSKDNTAEKWQGYYTVALPVENVAACATEDLAPTGCGYLTFKMNGVSASQKGLVTWAGMLPNGTAISGTSTLDAPFELYDAFDQEMVTWAMLPIFKTTSTEVFAVAARIRRNAVAEEKRRCVLAQDDVVPFWSHVEKVTDVANWTVDFGVYGGYYNAKEDLAGCCTEYYETTNPALSMDFSNLGGIYGGKPLAVDPLVLQVTESAMKMVVGQPNPYKVSFSLARSTGVVTGNFKLPYVDEKTGGEKTLSATFKGIVLVGWGEGCGCGDYDKFLPFVNGSYVFSDKVEYQRGTATRTLTVKRGGILSVDKVNE